jgi:hypothetical protein
MEKQRKKLKKKKKKKKKLMSGYNSAKGFSCSLFNTSPFHSNQPNVNHPKARLHIKVCTVVTSNNIPTNRMTKRMAGNIGVAREGNVTVGGSRGGDSWELFSLPR